MTEITDSHNLVFSCRPFAINNFFSNSHFDILDCLGKAGKGVTTLTMNPLHSAVPVSQQAQKALMSLTICLDIRLTIFLLQERIIICSKT